MILGPNSKVAQRARDQHRTALLAAEKEKAERKPGDKAPRESGPSQLEEEGAPAPIPEPPPASVEVSKT